MVCFATASPPIGAPPCSRCPPPAGGAMSSPAPHSTAATVSTPPSCSVTSRSRCCSRSALWACLDGRDRQRHRRQLMLAADRRLVAELDKTGAEQDRVLQPLAEAKLAVPALRH